VLLVLGSGLGELTSNYHTSHRAAGDPDRGGTPASWRPTTRRWASTPTSDPRWRVGSLVAARPADGRLEGGGGELLAAVRGRLDGSRWS